MLTLVIIAGVIIVIMRQIKTKRVKRLDFLIIPIFAAVKAYTDMPHALSSNIIAELIATSLFALGIGAWQGFVTDVYSQGDVLYTKCGIQYLISWICLIFGRIIIKLLFEGSFTNFSGGEWLIWAGIAITWGTRSGILHVRHPEIGKALSEEKRNR
jgi:hypothetical protein